MGAERASFYWLEILLIRKTRMLLMAEMVIAAAVAVVVVGVISRLLNH